MCLRCHNYFPSINIHCEFMMVMGCNLSLAPWIVEFGVPRMQIQFLPLEAENETYRSRMPFGSHNSAAQKVAIISLLALPLPDYVGQAVPLCAAQEERGAVIKCHSPSPQRR
jgi:hypothetical protein